MKLELTPKELNLIQAMIDRCDNGTVTYDELRNKIEIYIDLNIKEEKKHGCQGTN